MCKCPHVHTHAHRDGGNQQWLGGDQFSVVTTVHAGGVNPAHHATTPTDFAAPPGQFMSPMNQPSSVSYTTSPHALGSAQWAPPNANLFPQNSVAVQEQMSLALQKPRGPPNATFPNQQPSGAQVFGAGGPGVPAADPARSQGSNLSAAAAAAAAVVAAATATAHATATLTLKPSHPQGFDGGGPPPPPIHSHTAPLPHSSLAQITPPQQQVSTSHYSAC